MNDWNGRLNISERRMAFLSAISDAILFSEARRELEALAWQLDPELPNESLVKGLTSE